MPFAQEPKPTFRYDIFFSYARADNHTGHINALVEAIHAGYSRFFPGKQLHSFFDTQSIENGEDWSNRLYTALQSSRVMVALLSENYLASPWCKREWQTWCEVERSRGWLSYMLQPIYYVHVPGSGEKIEAFLHQRESFLRQVTQYTQAVPHTMPHLAQGECLAEIMSRQAVDLQPWHSAGEDALQHEEIRNRLEKLIKSLERKVTLSSQGEQSPTNIPRHNKHFSGRIHELKHIRQCFAEHEPGKPPVLYGIAGEGKTNLANTYAHAFAYEYPGGRRQVACSGLASLEACFIRLGEECGLALPPQENCPLEMATAARFAAVWQWLCNRPQGRVLVILDAVDAPALLANAALTACIQPTDRVHVLITTRCSKHEIGSAAIPIAVHSLIARDAIALLQSYRPVQPGENEADTEQAMAAVSQVLGGHALSLDLAGAFMRDTPSLCWAEYAAALKAQLLPVLEETRQEAAAQVCYAAVRQQQVSQLLAPLLEGLSPLEHRALTFACLLSPEEVVLPWVERALEVTMPQATHKSGILSPWKRTCKKLFGLCLWLENDKEGIARMHRLVHEIMRQTITAQEPLRTRQDIELLHAIALQEAEDYVAGSGTWQQHYFSAMPATLAQWLGPQGWEGHTQPHTLLGLGVALYKHILRWVGCVTQGTTLVQQGLAIIATMEALGLEHNGTAMQWRAAYTMLAGHIAEEQGDLVTMRASYVEAGKMYAHLCSQYPESSTLFLDHVYCLDYAGVAEAMAGNVLAAIQLHRSALALFSSQPTTLPLLREKTYTLDHLANALAACGSTTSGAQEIVALREESLAIRHRLFQENPNNMRALRDYTIALDYMGDTLAQAETLPEALAHYSRALEFTQAACLQAPHNITLTRDHTISLNKIGDMLARMGDNDDALRHYEKACALRRKLAAAHAQHNNMLKDYSFSLMRVATLQAQQGENPIPNYRMALEIRKHLMQLQPGNATYIYSTANCLAQLGRACLQQQEAQQGNAFLEEAHTLMQQLVHGISGPSPAAWQALLQETTLP